MAEVIMPKMGDAMTEGKILSWRKRHGDRVEKGEVLAEIETDKVNVEIEAEASGILQILVPEGQVVPVGQVIAYIDGQPAEAAARQAPSPAAQPEQAPAAEPAPAPSGPPTEVAPPRVKASPLARRIAAEHGIDLAQVRGTGPGGRVVERDVLAYLESRATRAPAPAEAEYEDVPLSRMRQAISRVVTHSKQQIPHFYVTAEVDLTRALELREQLQEALGEEGRVTVNDLVLKATALALRQHPDLNSQVVDERTLRRFRRVHLGIMVATPDGLIAPVLRDADRLPLLQLAKEARRLVEGAHARRLRQEEYAGATFSVSNLGMYDVVNFVAIIQPPQAGILAVGRAQERPVVRSGQVVVRSVLQLTVSADHRVTDGVGAAQFLVNVKRLLENPVRLLL
ncbi:MAG: dihydrolipoamide acetyltransferase family protein [Armatimonadota bacterium]|nr:dihydrolipoamide acetyltransferase family protein [Armatimonadota bacterium]MDR5675947.1 dihydrolipoamide acetyltransferase family protein [Armatimonadota bacterium]MDR5689005.1 dihydrolipoamide acetyltransferase family protein [Armatimonadota bacterium]MDR7389291.1 dihydrolipoamide acetyltransferase family protein [Armatimonadota bacterium]MDR7399119.1 dihydrolipoamide acetyltransferase family protein [Armatimonadota bacterium]